jgi:hypothetical protein
MVVVEKSQVEKVIGISRHRWEDNIKNILKKIKLEVANLIVLARNKKNYLLLWTQFVINL